MNGKMLTVKGQSYPDGTYEYTCGKCHGTGLHGSVLCDWCYWGNFVLVRDKLKSGVRGQQYYSLLKEFLRIAGKAMVAEAWAIKDVKMTPVDIAYLSLRFGLNLKATFEWLEECAVIRTGVYDYLTEGGVKVKQMHEAARAKYPVIEEWKPASEGQS